MFNSTNRVVSIDFKLDDLYNSYTAIVSYVDVGSMAYVVLMRYDEAQGSIIPDKLVMIS